MLRKKRLPAAMAAVIALGASSVAVASADENESAKEVSAVLNANTSISQAIATAEKQTAGRAMKVNLEREKGAYQYEVKTVSKDKVSAVFIDPTTGKVTRSDDEGLIAKVFDQEDKDEYAKLAASPVTLSAAIATAEKETGGKVMEAAFESEDRKPLFEVEVAKDTAVQKVMIDAASGNVVDISAAEVREHKKD